MRNKIFIVEDELKDIDFLKKTLKKEKYEVIHAKDGKTAFNLLAKDVPDLIILDIVLPDTDGFEICKRIRQDERLENLPILFFTQSSKIDDKLLGLQLGASDFLTKTSDERELLIRIKNLLRSKRLYDEMVKLSVIDSLTHIYNRRYFQHRMLDEIERGKRYNREFCCIIIDVDNFKPINDTYGHPVGDAVLKKIAAFLRRSTRTSDVLCRYGGDEFGLLLPETDLRGAYTTAERIRKLMEKTDVGQPPELSIYVTLSFGISSLVAGGAWGMDELVTQADVALYKAKRHGRNQTVVYGED